ncbi:GNAT family N-acetyltransferase [bacterium SCSIO 12741]|nr:GNAT family N-acetyltransferase [bacterium SCSIO 12741]
MPVLQGHKVSLRALEPTDIDLLFEWENNTEVWKISNTITPFSRFTLEQYITSNHDIFAHKQLRLVICIQDQAIGCVDLFDFDPINHRVGIGILIADEEQRQKGFAADALNCLLDYCREYLDCHQVYCNIMEENKASVYLFEKAGFVLAGTKKDWVRQGDTYVNELLYQKILGLEEN